MKIKIGNFNFINNKEDRIYFNSYNLSSDLFNYFYLDGREDTLYVLSRDNFDKAENEAYNSYSEFNFERELLKNHYVIDYNMKIKNEVDSFIRGKVLDIFNNREYSRYNLYNNISLNDIFLLEQNSKFILGSQDSYIDFKNNKIVKDGIIFNPYLEKMENLEELYNEGRFNKQIKAGLIKMEIENNIAPKFVTSFIKMNDFLVNKKSVNLILDDCEKFKINPYISSFLNFKGNKVSLNLSYNEEKWFERENPGKNADDLKLEDLKGLSYGKEVLKLDPEDFKDLEKQISVNPRDKLLFKIDKLEENLNNDFMQYNSKLYKENRIGYTEMPYNLEECLNRITRIDINNNQIDTKEKVPYPKWYSRELEDLFVRHDLVKGLKQFETLEELKDISKELDDEELIDICNEFIGYEENNEEEEDEL